MFCPRCATELSDAAYACSKCGLVVSPSVQASSAFSTPPAAAVSYQPQAPSFSYLPAGMPQWPAVVPPFGQASYPLTSALPGQAERDIEAEKPPTRRRSVSIPAMFLIFAACIVVGGGLTFGLLQLGKGNSQPQPTVTLHITPGTGPVSPTPTTTNQLPTPTSFLSLSNTDVNLSFKYPSDWTLDPTQLSSQGALIDLHPNSQNGLLIEAERFTTSASASFKTTADVNNNNIAQIQSVSGLTNFQKVQPPAPQQMIGGAQWDEQDITFSNSSGLTFYLVTIAVLYKNQYYDILYSAPQTVFNEAVQKYYQPMLSSLKFLA